jgi:hypothetical protein
VVNIKFISLRDLLNELESNSYKLLQVHHTWKPDHSDFTGDNHMALQEGMKNYHVNNNGWADIAQHITIFPDGKIVTGRDFSKDPVGIIGNNKKAFMFEMVGNFDKGKDVLKGRQLKTMLHIINYFIKRNIYIMFHRENSPKTCPGSSIDKGITIQLAKEIENISDWALDSVAKAMYLGVTDGTNPGHFLTFERYITIQDRLGLLD